MYGIYNAHTEPLFNYVLQMYTSLFQQVVFGHLWPLTSKRLFIDLLEGPGIGH